MPKQIEGIDREEHLHRLRRICLSFPDTTEKLSHGEPTFFVRKRVFAMFDNNHHEGGHVAVWVPAGPGMQALLMSNQPDVYFCPPYVGVKGWVGIELERIGDEDLRTHLLEAWKLVAPPRAKKLAARQR